MSVTTRYKFGGYILTEKERAYYVYKLENVDGDVRETYVGPLTDVVETYLKLKDSSGGLVAFPERARGDLNPRPPAPQAGTLSWLSYGPIIAYSVILPIN